MPDDYDDQDGQDLVPRSHIRQLEEKAKKASELEAQLEAARRENAFAKALGSLDHPGLEYFQKGYDGELDVEAIREAAARAGFLKSQSQAEDTQSAPAGPTPAEMAAHARMQASSEGAGGNRPIDLIEAMGPRGSKKPEEVMEMLRAAGPGAPFRLAEDMQ